MKDAKYYEDRLNTIINATGDGDGTYKYTANIRNWENYGKSRTYFTVIETRTVGKHYAKYDYGYFDNIAGVYVKTTKNDLDENLDVRGSRF